MVHFNKKIDKAKLPNHIAIIMDGNGRWAKTKNMPRSIGHRNGVKSALSISIYCLTGLATVFIMPKRG